MLHFHTRHATAPRDTCDDHHAIARWRYRDLAEGRSNLVSFCFWHSNTGHSIVHWSQVFYLWVSGLELPVYKYERVARLRGAPSGRLSSEIVGQRQADFTLSSATLLHITCCISANRAYKSQCVCASTIFVYENNSPGVKKMWLRLVFASISLYSTAAFVWTLNTVHFVLNIIGTLHNGLTVVDLLAVLATEQLQNEKKNINLHQLTNWLIKWLWKSRSK